MRRTFALWLAFLGCAVATGAPARKSPGGVMVKLTQLGQWTGANYGDHLAFAPDGQRWAAGREGSVTLFHDAQVERQLDPPPHADDVRFSADGAQLYAGPF